MEFSLQWYSDNLHIVNSFSSANKFIFLKENWWWTWYLSKYSIPLKLSKDFISFFFYFVLISLLTSSHDKLCYLQLWQLDFPNLQQLFSKPCFEYYSAIHLVTVVWCVFCVIFLCEVNEFWHLVWTSSVI